MKSFSRVGRFLFRIKQAGAIFLYPERFRIYLKETIRYHNLSFSQYGEDRILYRLFDDVKESGFYVDVGAHHPQRYSNTYYFYLIGWRGINIDPLPGSMLKFQNLRPLDINLDVAISEKEEELIYNQFNDPALNTFSQKIANERDGQGGVRRIGKKRIVCRRLDDVLDRYLPKGQRIDFLSVDVEGLDLSVLRSNDWNKYSPVVVVVEELHVQSYKEMHNSPVVIYMMSVGYELYSKAVNTLFFIKNVKFSSLT